MTVERAVDHTVRHLIPNCYQDTSRDIRPTKSQIKRVERESTMGATERLAQFITDTHYETLPEEVISAAKIGIMDGVANMLAGATQPLAAIIGQYVRQLGGVPQCSVVGHDLQTNAPSAAFANGVFLHCLDFEIQGQPPTHGTSAVLPPALALGEMTSAPGTRLIEAYVIG